MLCLAFRVTCLSAQRSRHGQRAGLLALITVAYAIVSHGNIPTYVFDLRHYLDTNLRAEKRVTAINIGLKTSSDLYTCLRRKTCQMRTLELHYCKE